MGKGKGWPVVLICFSVIWQACYRNDIGFGNLPGNNYTNIVFIDTVAPVLTTETLDSFSTGGPSAFLLGKYKDPYLGLISARPFFEMTIPASVPDIPLTAKFDSICFIIKPNKYHYGDTSRPQTITVNQLAEQMSYAYNNTLFNTTNFSLEPFPLGSRTVKIRPSVDDSILIRLNDSKGMELFSKFQQRASEILTDNNFQTYFKGISLSVGPNDTTAVYGFKSSDTSMTMRLYYHTTIPYFSSQSVLFTQQTTGLSFNQIITDRSGTPLVTSSAIKEFPSSKTNHLGFTQYGAGVLLKLTFPSVQGILATDKVVVLQKAELVVRPLGGTYDPNRFPLPDNLSLYQTDATDVLGSLAVSNVPPVTDEIYGVGTYYKFDVTSFINTLLTTPGSQDKGFFLIQAATSPNVTRAVIGDHTQPLYKTELQITAVVVSK